MTKGSKYPFGELLGWFKEVVARRRAGGWGLHKGRKVVMAVSSAVGIWFCRWGMVFVRGYGLDSLGCCRGHVKDSGWWRNVGLVGYGSWKRLWLLLVVKRLTVRHVSA